MNQQLLDDLNSVEALVCDGGWAKGAMRQPGLVRDLFCLEGAMQQVCGITRHMGLPQEDGSRFSNLYFALRTQMRLREDSYWYTLLNGRGSQWNSLWAWNDEQTSAGPILELIQDTYKAALDGAQ